MSKISGYHRETISDNMLNKEQSSSSSTQPEIVKLKGKHVIVGSEPEIEQKINCESVQWRTGNDRIRTSPRSSRKTRPTT